MSNYVIGIDVGTGSARAGVFSALGELHAAASYPIQMWRPQPDHVEQSSEDIWLAVCRAVKDALAASGISPDDIRGISYDATCSLVVLGELDKPLSVALDSDPERNIIVWMDHRALSETEEINSGDYNVLKYVGGKLSPEMEVPKLLWLKRHLPDTYNRSRKFLDLADYLTYRSTGVDARSLCTVVCKWTYDGSGARWDRDFFNAIGLSDIFLHDRVVDDIRPMGSHVGNLTPEAASDLGLSVSCAVGIGIIDAHSGGLGVLGSIWNGRDSRDPSLLETALALIGGTSNCHMAVSREPKFIEGIWGPYYGAMVPGTWLTEGGQSSAGSAIDHVISDHANARSLADRATATGSTVYELLNAEISRLTTGRGLQHHAYLTSDLHVLPYFLGNRSPHADPYAKATLDGLSLDESITSQALVYLATIQAVAYGTRDIVRAMNESGYRISTLFVTGGGTKNRLWLQEHADATGLRLVLPREAEAVLLGAAILAASAAGIYSSVTEAMQEMSRAGTTIEPNLDLSSYHSAKFRIFQGMYQQQLERRQLMKEFGNK